MQILSCVKKARCLEMNCFWYDAPIAWGFPVQHSDQRPKIMWGREFRVYYRFVYGDYSPTKMMMMVRSPRKFKMMRLCKPKSASFQIFKHSVRRHIPLPTQNTKYSRNSYRKIEQAIVAIKKRLDTALISQSWRGETRLRTGKPRDTWRGSLDRTSR